MAIGKDAAAVFETLATGEAPLDSLLMLGRQSMALLPSEIQVLGSLGPDCDKGLVEEIRAGGFADRYLSHLGFDRVESLDFSPYEGCSLVHDLNQPIPEEWHQYAQVVFDGGTLEHVFHFPNAIANAMNLVKRGGLFISCCPSNGYNGHGFYQFSPELMFRLFDKPNGFRVELLAVAEARPGGRVYLVADPAQVGQRVGFDKPGLLQIILVAKREEIVSVLEKTPQQSDYTVRWGSEQAPDGLRALNAPASPVKRLKRLARGALPESLVEKYDYWRAMERYRRESMAGLTPVDSLAAAWKG